MPQTSEENSPAVLLDVAESDLAEIGRILSASCGFCISSYKDAYIKRRISRRMRSCNSPSSAAYCELLRCDDREPDILKKMLTVHVSRFFRNPEMFDELQRLCLPDLFSMADAEKRPLRIWSMGCAGGEEAYSLAILVQECGVRRKLPPFEIHAFDVDADILQSARQGIYGRQQLADLTDDLRQKYFTPVGGRMQIMRRVRSLVTFHQQDIRTMPEGGTCDLILCRNTLIYFNRPDQQRIITGIARALEPGGILVLGKAESMPAEARSFFTTVSPVARMYRRT